ncbi:MAG: bifunctional DNA-formamidopyrimidine glycosylase/DNA-(apurinic or apyrimidinic site) lyase [Pyrinomonadaceae bacterium]
MPELPEVEHVSRSLNSLVRGSTIISARLLRERLAPDITPDQFAAFLRSASINFIHRRGKHILFDLSTDRTLIVHLRMSGRFSLLTAEVEDPKFTHAVFHFADDTRLVFDDQRHFGLMKVVETATLFDARELAKLAPEPFSGDFTIAYLRSALKTTKRTLKEFLLDQTKVCGLGNIYASEAMFAARIDPRTAADKVSAVKAARLHESIRAVLSEAIEHSLRKPVDPRDIDGGYFDGAAERGWLVYDREKDPCIDCKRPIVRIKQGGRSTFFCRHCQRK